MRLPSPRLLLISDAPGNPTGLGGQSRLVYEAAVEAGFHVVVANLVIMGSERSPFPRFFHAGGMVPEYLVSVPLGPDHLGYILTEFDPHLIVALCDAWMLGPYYQQPRSVIEKTILWTTADHEFFPEGFSGLYDRVQDLVFMAEFGRRSWSPGLHRAPGTTHLIPHAVDGDVFKPRDPAMFEAQKRSFGVAGHFIALHVGRNQHRKQQPLLIEGWARFVESLEKEQRGNVTLYLHTEPTAPPFIPVNSDPIVNMLSVLFSGINLPRFIAKNYSADVQKSIRFSERNVPREGVAMMYSLADVCAMTSTGEGFSICLIEAQASGRANISANNTTTPEIVGGEAAMMGENGAVIRAEGEVGGDPAFHDVPFGWRAPCNSFTVQPDFSGKRPQVDCAALAAAFRDAYIQWRLGVLNSAANMQRRRSWTLARYGWPLVKTRWRELLSAAKAKLS